MKKTLGFAIVLLAGIGCSQAADEGSASTAGALEDDAVCMDDDLGDDTADDGSGDPTDPGLTTTEALPFRDFAPVGGSVTPVVITVGPVTLPEQFVTPRIGITPTVTCSLTPTLGYSVAPAANGQISVTLTASVTGTCYVQIDGQRYGIIHPTVHGNTTVSVTISGSANLTTALDCANIRSFTPSVTVSLGASVSYTDPIVDVYGRCGRRRPILSNIAQNQARQAAAQAAAQVQALIDGQLATWQGQANDWLAQQVSRVAATICGSSTATPVATPITPGTPTPTPTPTPAGCGSYTSSSACLAANCAWYSGASGAYCGARP